MEYYSATRNNGMVFEGEWIQLEDIILSEVRFKNTNDACFPHTWKIDPKINIYTKIRMIIYKLVVECVLE
jgi:hypothetical protein